MKVEGWKFIFRFNLWSCCLIMGWEVWLLYLNLQVCTNSFGPWTQRQHPSVFRYNFFYRGSRRKVLLFLKGNRQGEPSECVLRLQIINFLPHKTGSSASLVPSVSWVSSGCLLKQLTLECNYSLLGFIQGLLGGVLPYTEGKTRRSQWSLKS